MLSWQPIIAIYLVLSTLLCTSLASVFLNEANLESTLAQHELVFVDFYADWCHFSQMLKPIFEETAKSVAQGIGKDGRVILAFMDCEKENTLCGKFNVNKYPTMKLFRFGKVTKNEYRSERSKQALENFVKDQLLDPIQYLTTDVTDKHYEDSKRYIIGYFDVDSENFGVFKKLASSLRHECKFLAINRMKTDNLTVSTDTVIFHNGASAEELKYSNENLTDFDSLQTWTIDRCVPLVQTLTFQNAEELTEEGLPFFILFHHPDDKETPKLFAEACQKDLHHQKYRVKLLTADGVVFSHPLMHLGKTASDLPVITIDSFKHMYVFPTDVKAGLKNPALLNQFLEDLHSGKLHREYHYGPDPVTNEQAAIENKEAKQDTPTTPPKSIFQKLAPSSNRYTIIKDEL